MLNKKKVFALIDCSIPINTRNQKIINSLKSAYDNIEIHVITWNREGLSLSKDIYFHAYERKAAYANVTAKLQGLLGFKKYINQILKSISADVIIASHWSNLMLVAGIKKKGQTLIYENLDIPTGSFAIRHISCFIEKMCLRKVDLIIHASRFFRELYMQKIPQIILENKPAFEPNRKTALSMKPLKVAFVGSIRYLDILKNLVDALKNNSNFELYFHGGGEDLEALKKYCKNISNVFFSGKYDYLNVVSLYHQSDIIWAGYPNKDFNVVYAISNKFHESLYVGVPCVYSVDTKLANFVENNNLGFVVNPYSISDIKSLFDKLAANVDAIENVKKSMITYQAQETTWEEDFKQVLDFLNK